MVTFDLIQTTHILDNLYQSLLALLSPELQDILFQAFLPFLTAALIAYFAIPPIITVAIEKKLHDEPNYRKKHKGPIPTLGGAAIFAGIIISYTFWSNSADFPFFKYTLASIIILFFTGIKDDIIGLSIKKRLVIYFVAIGIIVFFGDIRLTNLNGIFGIYEIPKGFSYLLTIFVMMAITNSFNLIDGIDGLAAGIGMIILTVLGAWFFVQTFFIYAVLCFAINGALLGFLLHNFSPAKIFMGDTGALLMGFLISILTIKFIEHNTFLEQNFPTPDAPISFQKILSAPAFAVGLLIIPVFDTIRVMIVRLLNRKPLFYPDRNHLHYVLMDVMGFSAAQTCGILYLTNAGFILEVYYLQKLGTLTLLLVVIATAVVLSLTLRAFAKHRIRAAGQ